MNTKQKPEVTRVALLSMQVCVDQTTTDDEVEHFANLSNQSGLDIGWKIRKEGDPALLGKPERVPCNERAGCVHIMLDC